MKKLNFKTNRKLRIGTTATVLTVAVVAAAVLLNVIVGILNDRYPLSLDLTADKNFTLSEESREVAEKVEKDVTITVFADEAITKNPSTTYDELNTVLRQFHQFTNDYNLLTDGKVTTKYVDLDKNPTLQAEYAKYEVGSGGILFQCGDQWRAITLDDLYLADDSEAYYTGQYYFTSLVEQKLASNINAVCGGKTVVLTFLTGHGEDEKAIASLKSLYEMNGYITETVDFTTATKVNEQSEAMIIVGPQKDFAEDEITRLRAWMLNDGKRERDLFVFCNYAASCPNLYEYLEVDYGIIVTDNVIIETDENNIPLTYYGSEPYSPLTTVKVTDLTMDIGTGKVIMPLTLQLKTNGQTDDSTYNVTNFPVVTFPETAQVINITEKGEAKKADEYPVVGMAYAYDYDNVGSERIENYVMVCGSYQMIDSINSNSYRNKELLLIPMRTVCNLGDTTVISGRDLTATSVAFSALTANILGLGVFTIGIPALLILAAVIVFIKRRHL